MPAGHLHPCPGCGARVAASDGPTSPTLGASAGCWAVYQEVVARELGEFRHPEIHRVTVDAYAAQHPGEPSRKSIQALAAHLIGLYLVVEKGVPARFASEGIQQAVDSPLTFTWIEPPPKRGAPTILDVRGATHLAEHTRRVETWARAVWETWTPHHETVRRWAGV